MRSISTTVFLIGTGFVVLLMSGCASPPTPLPAGETCYSLNLTLNQLDREGAPQLVTRQKSGASLTADETAKANKYNQTLQLYIAARCHMTTKPPS